MDQFGKRLKRIRKERKLSQKDVGKAIGMTGSAYGFYEQGVRNPTIPTLRKLSQVLDVSVNYLVTGEEVFDQDEEEKQIIKKWRRLNDSDKLKIEGMIELKVLENEDILP